MAIAFSPICSISIPDEGDRLPSCIAVPMDPFEGDRLPSCIAVPMDPFEGDRLPSCIAVLLAFLSRRYLVGNTSSILSMETFSICFFLFYRRYLIWNTSPLQLYYFT